MATFPVLPGINTPLDPMQEKKANLEAKVALKKSLLGERTGVTGKEPDSYQGKFEDRMYQIEKEQSDAYYRNRDALAQDDEIGTTVGNLKQLGSSIASGITRMGGDAVSMGPALYADSELSKVPDDLRAIHNQDEQYRTQVEGLKSAEANLEIDVSLGKVDPIQAAARRLELRNQQKSLKAPDPAMIEKLDKPGRYESNGSLGFVGDLTPQGDAPSARQRIDAAKAALGFAKKVDSAVEDVTKGLVNNTSRGMLDSDMSESYKANKQNFDSAGEEWKKGDEGAAILSVGKGVAGLIQDLGSDALDNPQAVSEYIAENVPQLALGAFGKAGKALLATSNVAYGTDIYRKGLEDFQANNDGRLPSKAEAQEMLAWSLSAAAAEQVGDVLTLAPLKGSLGKVMGDAITKVKAGKALELAGQVGRVPAAVAAGVVTEAPTELYQTAVESNLSKLNSDFDGEELAKAAGIGGIVGGGLKGGVEVLAGGITSPVGAIADAVAGIKNPAETAQQREAAFNTAKDTGDVDALLDAKSPAYDPSVAVTALQEYAQKPDVEEEAVFDQAAELVTQKDALQSRRKAILDANTPELRAAAEDKLTEVNAQLAVVEDAAEVEALNAQKAEIMKGLVSDQVLEHVQTTYDADQEILAGMNVSLQGWKQQRTTADLSPETLDLADSPAADLTEDQVAGVSAAVDKTITLAMRGAPALSPERMEAISSNLRNALNPQQRDYLGKAAAARRAETEAKDLSQVSTEVLVGGNGNLGLANYQENFAKAQQGKNPVAARAALSGLASFAEVHRAKLDTFAEAFDRSLEDGMEYHFKPEGNGIWTAVDAPEAGGITISKKSARLMTGIDAEVKALETGVIAMKAAMNLVPTKSQPKPKVASKPAKVASATKTEPKAKDDVSTEPASKAKESAQATADFLLLKTPKTEGEKSDYAGQEAGKLKALSRKVPKSLNQKNFQFVNLPSMVLKQVGEKPNSVSPRPLVAVNNFATHLKLGDLSVSDFLSNELTEAQAPLVGQFVANHDNWAEALKKVLRRPVSKQGFVRKMYFFRDPIQYFVDDEKNMEENFVTALVAAGFNFISEEVNSPVHRTDDEIKAMNGLSESDRLDPAVAKKLRKVLGRRTVLEYRIGQFATDALGFKLKDENSPQNELHRLRGNLGAHVVDMMSELGLIKVENIELDDSGDLTANNFISLVRNKSDVLSEPLEQIRSVSRSTAGVMTDLFGMETGVQLPLFAAPKIDQQSTNNGKQKLAPSVKKAFDKIAKREYQFRPAMKMLQGASQQFLEDLAGIESLNNQVMHKELRDSFLAANENLGREFEMLQNLWDLMEAQGDTSISFYALPDQWKNSRVGYRNLWANMQTSKIARFLVAPKGWEAEVSLEATEGKDQVSLDNFKLRVLEGLNKKTDSTPDAVTLATFDSVVGTDNMVAAIKGLQGVVKGEPFTKEIEAAVSTVVKEVGTKMHAFEALMALAQYQNAKETVGSTSFKTMVTTEVDGKTNGPMLSLWLLGVMNETLAQMGGFYTKASNVVSFGHWKPGNNDLYQYIASKLVGNLQTLNIPENVLASLYNLIGNPLDAKDNVTSAGRNLVKNPLTTLIYGSGMSTTVEKMTDVFIERVYETVGSILKGESYGSLELKNEAAWTQFQKDLQMLAGTQDKLFPDFAEDGLETSLSKSDLAALREGYMDSIGEAVTKTIETELADYMTARKAMVRQANVTWNLYDITRTKLLDQLREHLMDEGVLPFTTKKGVRTPERDLTKAEEAEALKVIADLEPRFHTALSQRDGQLDAGIYVAKNSRKTNSEAPYASTAIGTVQGEDTNHSTVSIVSKETDPGVSVMANGVQSVDGNIIVEVIAQLNAVGVHDALLVGLKESMEAGQALNQQTLNMLLDYSLPRQSLDALSRTLIGYVKYVSQNPKDFDSKVLGELLRKQKESEDDEVSFKILVERAAAFAYKADRVRLNGLSKLGVVDQYTIEAGAFVVPDSFRDQAAKMRDQVSRSVDPALMQAAQQLDALMVGEMPGKGAKNKASKPVQLTLDQALRSKENLTAGEVIAFVQDQIGKPAAGDVMGNLYKQILAQGASVLKDLPVKYITAAQVNDIPEAADEAYGWYHTNAQGESHIGIRGSDLPGSAVSPELVVHEVLHALVTALIQQAEKGQGTLELRRAVVELKAIQSAVKDSLASDTAKQAQFKEALGSIHEFVTWGMTNPGFQEVLKGIAYAEAKAPNLKNRAHQFFQTIAKIVFGVRAPAMTNALSHLFARVSTLLAEATPKQEEVEGTFTMAAAPGPLELNPLALFDALGGGYVDPAMQAKVQGLMGSVVSAVGGPFQTFYQQASAGAKTAMDVILNAQQQGLMPVADGLRTSGFAMNDQMAYAVEVLTEALHPTQRNNSREVEKQLLSLFQETSKTVKPADLGGQAQWDALFDAKAIDTDGQYLARFAAMALAYPPLAQKMGFTTQDVPHKATTLYARVLELFERIVNALAKSAHKAYAGQQADAKLDVLVGRLVALEAKYQIRQDQKNQESWVDTLEDSLDAVSEKGREQLAKFGRNPFFTQSNNVGIKLLGNLTTSIAENRVGHIIDAAESMYHRSVKGQMGFLASMLNEVRGARASNLWSRVMTTVSKVREKTRQDMNRDIAKAVRESFANKGKDLTREDKAAITGVLLRTGASALLDNNFTLAQIQQMLTDPAELDKAIHAASGNLTSKYQHFYLKQANYLGYMLATGQDRGPHTLLNVENIARLSQTYYASMITEAEAQAAIPLVDVLVTLRALKYSDDVQKAKVARLMGIETQRTDKGNGVLATMLLHKGLLAKAKDRVFQGSERLMRKGYVPGIHNPYLEVTAVPLSKVREYEEQGYKQHSNLKGDPADVTWEPRVLMSIERVTPRYRTGSLSLTSMKAQGSKVHSGLELFDFSGSNEYNYRVNRAIEARRGKEIQALFSAGAIPDLTKTTEVRMTPVTNDQGKVVNYRYMMSHENRDLLLERTNDMDLVLGELASNTFDKETTVTHNDRVISGLKNQWELEKASIPEAYIVMGPDSTDVSIREQYRLLPTETRRTIEAVWGGPNMMVRRDTYDLHFGYRDYSLTESMNKAAKDRNTWEKLFGFLAEDLFKVGPKATQRVLKAENMIMALNQEIKDFFVVKSGVTTYWNIVSNLSLLKLYGVSIPEIVRSHIVALKGARDWQKHDSELRRLQAMRDSGYIVGSSSDLDQQIAILEDFMARSPVREVMGLGMMPTIVEDMDEADDPYSYKNYAAKKADKLLQYVPNFIKTGSRWVYMTHDTPLYQVLSQGAQLSDFVARYTLYEHLKTRRVNPLAQAEAAHQSIEAFINYDHLSHRMLQYMNSMGIVRFTKYYMRIQAVLMHLYQQNPARALILTTLENYFSGVQTVTDSTWWNRIGIPLENGPLDYPEAIGSGLVSKTLLKLF